VSEVLPEEILQPIWRRYLGLPESGMTIYAFEKDDLDIYVFAMLEGNVKTTQLVIQRKPPPPELPKPTWRQRLGAWIHG
jgi:hypothetical protein